MDMLTRSKMWFSAATKCRTTDVASIIHKQARPARTGQSVNKSQGRSTEARLWNNEAPPSALAAGMAQEMRDNEDLCSVLSDKDVETT